MQKEKDKHIKFYLDCIKTRRIPHNGLCSCSSYGHIDDFTLNLFVPTDHDEYQLDSEGLEVTYWGSGLKKEALKKFTPLRQTIVLFMAAINNEL